MTVRDNIHRLVDELPEERLEDAIDLLTGLGEEDEALSADTDASIAEGLRDIREGRVVTLEEYRRKRGL